MFNTPLSASHSLETVVLASRPIHEWLTSVRTTHHKTMEPIVTVSSVAITTAITLIRPPVFSDDNVNLKPYQKQKNVYQLLIEHIVEAVKHKTQAFSHIYICCLHISYICLCIYLYVYLFILPFQLDNLQRTEHCIQILNKIGINRFQHTSTTGRKKKIDKH